MDVFQKIALAGLLLLGAINANAQLTNVQVIEQVNASTVSYVIHNSGNNTLQLTFVIIQDEILLREQGSLSLEAGATMTISTTTQEATSHQFRIELTEELIGG